MKLYGKKNNKISLSKNGPRSDPPFVEIESDDEVIQLLNTDIKKKTIYL